MELSPVLKIDGLRFHFDTRPVFAGFSLALGPGITWLRGANGKGKTTLLKLLAGALAPNAGSIAMDGVDSAQAPVAYRLRSFYCGGESPDLPWLTVAEWLGLHLALYPSTSRQALDAQLGAFGINEVLPQPVTTLSLGQHKKLQLALALALPVTLLLIDEPFNGLDAAGMAYLRGELEQRAAALETCIVLTSHLDPQLPVARTLDLDLLA
ncbi:MAG: transporter ATP-binding protein [Massilia sp.]|jgi:ABC-2 type transport system ATP-binding protein|nr:transporter ATP-binding protein [Massilia sp.]